MDKIAISGETEKLDGAFQVDSGVVGRHLDIGEAEVREWQVALLDRFAPATFSKYTQRAKQAFRHAKRVGLLDANPFSELKASGEENAERKRFVSREEIERAIACAPDIEWRTILALARYGGLRTPSETLGLRWSDIDWEAGTFRVTSPKTRKQGKPFRVVPLFPELREHLAEGLELAAPGQTFVITRYARPRATCGRPSPRSSRGPALSPGLACSTT